MFELAKARPPHVRFERQTTEKRKLVEEGGASYLIEEDYAYITPIGDKDTRVRLASDWLAQLEVEVGNDRFPQEWLDGYRRLYEAFCKGQEMPVEGTPLRTWPGVSPKEAQLCISLHILTVEDLATINEQAIARLGMGGRALRMRAQEYLNNKDSTDVARKVEALTIAQEAIVARNARLEQDNQALLAEVTMLRRSQGSGSLPTLGSLEDRLADVQGDNDPEETTLRAL